MVIVETADLAWPIPPLPNFELLVEATNSSERHSVYAHGTARLRLCVRHVANRAVAAYAVPLNADCLPRLAAVTRLAQAACRKRCSPLRGLHSSANPTTYQSRRLIQLLAIHDAQAAGASPRDLAFGLVFRGHPPLAGALWKGSSERRHVLRLIAEARRLVASGYRQILLHR